MRSAAAIFASILAVLAMELEDLGPDVQELPVLSSIDDLGSRWQQHLRIEDLKSLENAVAFRARIGDGHSWSAWSVASSPLEVFVKPPKPATSAVLTVKEMEGMGSAEVSWPAFELAPGLARVDYLVRAVCTSSPEDSLEQLLPGTLAAAESEGGTLCRTCLRRLVPDTEYVISVTASYPQLSRFCIEEPAEEMLRLKAVFHTSGIDATVFEPPAPPRQIAPSALRGGAERRSPWSLDFWLEVDQRALPDSQGPAYVAEWRQVIAPRACEAEWRQAKLDVVGKDAPPCPPGLAVCTFDLGEALGDEPVPEIIELRLRLENQSTRIAASSRAWLSRAVELPTAYASVPKPRTLLRMAKSGGLEFAMTFLLCDHDPSDPATARIEEVQLSPKQGRPKQPPMAHGHRFAERLQLRHRLAGDQHDDDEAVELASQTLCRSSQEEESTCPLGWHATTVTVPALFPDFSEGERRVFSVRIGDSCRWSPWSSFSKPVHVKVPPLLCSDPQGLAATPKPPATVMLEWDSLHSELGEVEYALWLVAIEASGREANGSQLLGIISGGGGGRRQGEFHVGHLEPGAGFLFKLMARSKSHVLGPLDFVEFSRTEVITWHAAMPAQVLPVVHDGLPAPRLAAESWDLPMPVQIPVPDDLEAGSGRWRGRAVLLAWPKGLTVSENPPLELQVCEDSKAFDEQGWLSVTWALLRMHELPCIAASALPFSRCRFRWYSRDRRIPGPRSESCVAFAEPPTSLTAETFCTLSAVRVKILILLREEPSRGARAASQYQLRYQAVQRSRNDDGTEMFTSAGDWQNLPQSDLASLACTSDGSQSFCMELGEEDGLELASLYCFSARVGDSRRQSSWSISSEAIVFDVPESYCPAPISRAGLDPEKELLVEALSLSSVRCWWPELQAKEVREGRPRLEYRLDISRCFSDGRLERHATILTADKELNDEELGERSQGLGPAGAAPFESVVNGLLPGSRYFAALFVRFSRLGRREWRKTGLKASFETPAVAV